MDEAALAAWRDEVRRLAREQDALILAHNYQRDEIQDIADHVGDSLQLARLAEASTASTIVLCGVYFMAETAKLLAPDRTVLIPDNRAGCSLSDTITGDQLREWKAEHPGAVVVSYVNTSAEVKAETDICCTSSNAVAVVNSIPADQEILFLPDQFLGQHVRRETGRDNIHVWMGECHVHAAITGPELERQVHDNPDAELLIHPECGCSTSALYLLGEGVIPAEHTHVLSTGGMIQKAKELGDSKVLVATEIGMLHQLRLANPRATFEPVNRAASCQYMKMITAEALLASLRERKYEVTIPEDIAVRARLAVERMTEIAATPVPSSAAS